MENPYFNPDGIIEEREGRLPHWHQDGKLQFVTLHLKDSIPASARNNLNIRLQEFKNANPGQWTPKQHHAYNVLTSKGMHSILDNGYGMCVLKNKYCAEIVGRCLEHLDNSKYHLLAYVVMSNHVHLLLCMIQPNDIFSIVTSFKKYTSRQINKITKGTGSIWHKEYWDRIVRDEYHRDNIISYIRLNITQGGIHWLIK